jgi:Ca-activated chloride channel homolog
MADLPRLQQGLNALLRSALLAVLAVALARPVLTDEQTATVTTVFVVDVSASVPDSLLEAAHAALQEAWEQRGDARLRLVTFARDAQEIRWAPSAERVPPPRRHEGEGAGLESRLGTGLRLAYGLFRQDDIRRVVIVSDGFLERAEVLSEVYAAASYGIEVSVLELPYERPDEVLIADLQVLTSKIVADEPFEVRLDLFSTWTGEVRLDVQQNEFRDIRGRRLPVTAGEITQHVLELEVYEPGLRTFDISIRAERDTVAENNRFVQTFDVSGRPRVLYVEGESRARTYLARALDDARNPAVDFELDVRTASGLPRNVAELRGFDLVIVSDVESRDMSRESMDALRRYVRDEGGSFLNVGGQNSFGPGGYQGTIIEEILPVTFEGRRLETMPSVALMLVIDRSGSMEGVKLEMAKDAARAAVELLGPQDRVGVLAFDTRPQTIVRLQSASNRLRINTDIGRITPGGGTDILPALEEAYVQLLDTRARIKHVILLTDGEAPREGVAELVRMMRGDRITISTVGVGGEVDRNLLEMIADLSGGRYHQTNSPSAIPQIFVQETSQVARTSLIEEPFRPRLVTDSAATRGIDFGSVPYLLGYVSTRPRSRATVGLQTDLGEPLYAWWRLGRGRAAVFTSDLKNRWMVEWIREPVYQRFWTQVVQHLMRPRAEEHELMAMEAWVEEGRGRARLDAIGEDDAFINGLTSVLTVTGPDGSTQEVTLEQTAAGRYEAEFPLEAFGSYLLEAIHTREGESIGSSLVSLPHAYPAEYLTVGDDRGLLRQAVTLVGGEVDPEPAALFARGEAEVVAEREVWPECLFLALGLLIADVLLRRIRLYGKTALDWGAVTRRA